MARVKRLLVVALLLALPAAARRTRHSSSPAKSTEPKALQDPSHWFAMHQGLLRVYQARAKGKAAAPQASPASQASQASNEAPPHAGASCEVVESHPPDSLTVGSMRERCSMIVGRKPRPAAELSYQLRPNGIYAVRTQTEGSDKAQSLERLILPSPLKPGASWHEAQGPWQLDRSVKSVGQPCKAGGRNFADCVVLAVTQRQGKKVVRTYGETYAAGLGLVEDAQWELIDVKGL